MARPSLALGLAVAAWAGLAAAQTVAVVTLPAAAQARLGVTTAALPGVQHATEIDAFAKVLDPSPLAQSESDLETAEAAAAASHAEYLRSKALHDAGGSVATKDLEANEAQAVADAAKVVLIKRQIDMAWGPGVSRLSEARRKQLVAALSSGAAALVHVDTHNNEGEAGARRVRVDVGDGSVDGPVLGPARQAEPRLQSSGLIVEISGPSAMLLSVGLTQSAHIEQATAQSGVLIPRSAIVRFRGSDWAYVRVGPTTFQRRLVSAPAPEANGFFVVQGFAPGEAVVVQGVDALFAADQARPAGVD